MGSQCMLEEYAEDNFYVRFDTAIIVVGQTHRVAIRARRVCAENNFYARFDTAIIVVGQTHRVTIRARSVC